MYISFDGYRTYYAVLGTENDAVPVIMLHGGPGDSSDDFISLSPHLEKTGRRWIVYDQLGGGRSSSDLPRHLYKVDTWIAELKNLLIALNIRDFYLLGHSWGGQLALLYMLKEKPEGVRGLILSSSLSSTKLWASEARRLISYLSIEDQKAIEDAIERDDFTSLEYEIALYHYYMRYIYSADEAIPMVSFIAAQRERSSHPNLPYEIMWGKNEFYPQGTLIDYDVTDSLKDITTPCLILSGTDDESTPLINKTIFDNMGGKKRWVLFPGRRHSLGEKDEEEYVKTISEFIREIENDEF